jgi:hypothetical protein
MLVRAGPLSRSLHGLGHVVRVEQWRSSRSTGRESRRATTGPLAMPVKVGGATHAQLASDVGLGGSLRKHLRRPQPTRLQRREVTTRANHPALKAA